MGNAKRVIQNEFSSIFPLVTQCSFQVRQLQNVQTYTVQCVLLYNAFNEKKKYIYIYIYLWFWFIVLGKITGCNFIFSSVGIISRRIAIKNI